MLGFELNAVEQGRARRPQAIKSKVRASLSVGETQGSSDTMIVALSGVLNDNKPSRTAGSALICTQAARGELNVGIAFGIRGSRRRRYRRVSASNILNRA